MNGSSDLSTESGTKASSASGNPAGKTDTPIPINSIPEPSPRNAAPAASADRIISGIDLLDYGTGGLLPNKVYLVRGGPGVGKSLLGLQYLTRGLELQEPGVLITDQKPENVIAQAHAIGFAIEESVRRGQLSILNPSQRYFELVESPADVMAIVEELGDHVRSLGAKRLVIDPVFTLINTAYSSHFALSITQSLINALEDLPVTTLLIATHGDDYAENNPIVRQLEQNAFGVIDLSNDAATGGRMMRLAKCRYAPNDDLCAHYRILNGRGLINYRGEGEKVTDVTQPWEQTGETNRTVLLVGANQEQIKRVKEALGDEFKVQAEADLDAGVERAKREKPGLVIVTPQRSVGAVATILDLAQNATSSVAFLSPHANRQADKVLYLRAGADDFLTEPFTPAELRARVDALIRRSGRRLNLRGTSLGSISAEEMTSLMNRGTGDDTLTRRKQSVLTADDGKVKFDPEFDDRLQRSIDTVKKFDQPFALYWIKADADAKNLNRSLAKLCRQEDIVCHNRNGEFVAILTGTDKDGIKGFESRLNEKIEFPQNVQRGYSLYNG
jgi:KaiC/GvpD/RAD55 family RecA-like ATPase/DNA-binding response OmpR family regulator